MRLWLSTLLIALLTACAGPQAVTQRPDFLFRDDLFAAPVERIGADEVFALSASMRDYLRTEVARKIRAKGRQAALVDALFEKGELKLEYDSKMTRNAAQAFEARSGNCLSLVIMTAAFAKELGLTVRYQSAYVDPTWSRSGDLLVGSEHVNVTLGNRFIDSRLVPQQSPLAIDFLPAAELSGLRTREIAEDMVIAMYMNNRAVEALLEERHDDAYGWVREAIGQNPAFLNSYNTLGVIYLRHGNLAQAAEAFGFLLAREPQNTRAMSNLAKVFTLQGRVEEADALQRKLAQIEPYPPFHFFNLGLAAMKQNDYRTARTLFAKEVARADYSHEFHFWLGLANFELGDLKQARAHLKLALENSTTRRQQDLYAAKLDWLQAYRH